MGWIDELATIGEVRRRYLRPEAVAEILGLSTMSLVDWRKRGVGPAWIKLSPGRSGRIRYNEASLYEWIDGKATDDGWSPT